MKMTLEQLATFAQENEEKITDLRIVLKVKNLVDLCTDKEEYTFESFEFMMEGQEHLYRLMEDGMYEPMTQIPE